jgi:phospholipid/cholesterol/gamma-HCH transport system ATP-binding protein
MKVDQHNNKEIVVEMEHVKKSFGDKQVLKDVNLKLKDGENLVIMGRSGSGKSVLIKCLVKLIAADEGDLRILGKNVYDLDKEELDELRKSTGFLFQSGALYDSMTVKENLEFPVKRQLRHVNEKDLEEMVNEVLRSVGLEEAAQKMPSELSGGMRKRISLARTLILKPKLMLYDEPTTGLDIITSKEISGLIVEMKKKYKTSAIIITHDIECAKITADRILILEDGKFIAEGTFEELQNSDDKIIQAFFK